MSEVLDAGSIARRFVNARRKAKALTAYPGPVPADMQQGYAIQDRAIELWPDTVAGWKVGKIADEFVHKFPDGRLAGPIFSQSVVHAASEQAVDFPVFANGFSAVEAEYVIVIASDAPPAKTRWSVANATAMIAEVRIGIEIASSPLATINDLGPSVIVSDFGNNAGVVLGPPIERWRSDGFSPLTCETFIDGKRIGAGGASHLPGGPIASLRFLLALSARRNRPLRQGQLVSSGAATGVHDFRVGQTAVIDFAEDGKLSVRAVTARPMIQSG